MSIVPSEGASTAQADREPTAVELAGVEAQLPLIAAELEVLDAQIHLLTVGGYASVLDRRRVRRAERRVLMARQRPQTVSRTAPDLDGAA